MTNQKELITPIHTTAVDQAAVLKLLDFFTKSPNDQPSHNNGTQPFGLPTTLQSK